MHVNGNVPTQHDDSERGANGRVYGHDRNGRWQLVTEKTHTYCAHIVVSWVIILAGDSDNTCWQHIELKP